MKEKVLITAALPYANGPLHFGHIAGAYLPADCYARFQRLKGKDVLFICGSDEYGIAITLSAEMAGRIASLGRCSPSLISRPMITKKMKVKISESTAKAYRFDGVGTGWTNWQHLSNKSLRLRF